MTLKAFKQEFQELLQKHNAHISFSCGECSDTHGLYDERIEVYFEDSRKTHKLADGWGVDPSDL